MKFAPTIDAYIDDMRAQGRFRSDATERHYRDCLLWHGEDCDWNDPRMTTRDMAKRTLRRWKNPNTCANRRSILVSFYRWMVQEGLRKDNPAEQTPVPKRYKPTPPRPTMGESAALLEAAQTTRERRLIYLGVCAGLRNAELRGLQGRHFARQGLIWVSPDIAKGRKERWVPVPEHLEPIVAEIRESVPASHFVIPAQVPERPGPKRKMVDRPTAPASSQTIWRLTKKVGERAGLDFGPHMMRRAYADFTSRQADLKITQALLGHADISTTDRYISEPSLDELAAAIVGLRFGPVGGASAKRPANPLIARRGFEPLPESANAAERNLDSRLAEYESLFTREGLEELGRKVRLYTDHFRRLEVA